MLTVGTASKSKGKLFSLQNNERTFPRIPPDCTTAFTTPAMHLFRHQRAFSPTAPYFKSGIEISYSLPCNPFLCQSSFSSVILQLFYSSRHFLFF